MSATDELRRMLDERGVEYETADGWWTSWDTEGATSLGGVVYCEDLGDGLEIRWHTITPSQAIAATLGGDDSSRYSELFGTPERAASTLLDACDNCGQNDCSGCQVYELTRGGDLDYDALLEWLRGDAE